MASALVPLDMESLRVQGSDISSMIKSSGYAYMYKSTYERFTRLESPTFNIQSELAQRVSISMVATGDFFVLYLGGDGNVFSSGVSDVRSTTTATIERLQAVTLCVAMWCAFGVCLQPRLRSCALNKSFSLTHFSPHPSPLCTFSLDA